MRNRNEGSRIEAVFDAVAKNNLVTVKDIASFKNIADSLNLKSKSVLEIGCGMGDNLIYCASKGAVYLEGFDISIENIKIADNKIKETPDIHFFKDSMETYTPKRLFDVVIAWGVFEYFLNPAESLSKIINFCDRDAKIVFLISKPVFLKKIALFIRPLLSRLPIGSINAISKILASFLRVFNSIFSKSLYTGESNTYSLEQTILEGLMVNRYNIFDHRIFTDQLLVKGFKISYFNSGTPSMICFLAERNVPA